MPDPKLSEIDPETQAAVRTMLPQLLIVMLKRLGGKIDIPAKEMDKTGDVVMVMGLNPETRRFRFELQRKKQTKKKVGEKDG